MVFLQIISTCSGSLFKWYWFVERKEMKGKFQVWSPLIIRKSNISGLICSNAVKWGIYIVTDTIIQCGDLP